MVRGINTPPVPYHVGSFCYIHPPLTFLTPFLKQIPATRPYQAYAGQCNHTCHIPVYPIPFMHQLFRGAHRHKTIMHLSLLLPMHLTSLWGHVKSAGRLISQSLAPHCSVLTGLCLHLITILTLGETFIKPRATFMGSQVLISGLRSRLIGHWSRQVPISMHQMRLPRKCPRSIALGLTLTNPNFRTDLRKTNEWVMFVELVSLSRRTVLTNKHHTTGLSMLV